MSGGTPSRLTVGLTGGVASGKSTVTARLRARGVPVLDADESAHRLSAPGGAAADALASEFGRDVLAADGSVDRAALRRRVFADPGLRRRVESLLHPLILADLEAGLAAEPGPLVVLTLPLLLEAGLRDRVDRVWVVDCPPEIQLQRLLGRDGGDRATAQGILAAQLSRDERLAAADDVICNDASLAALLAQVDELEVFHRRLATAGGSAGSGRRLPLRRSGARMAP